MTTHKAEKQKVVRLPRGERFLRDEGERMQAMPVSLDDQEGTDGMCEPDELEDGERYHAGRPAPLDKIFR